MARAFASSQCSDTTVRIMSWNLLNFPSQNNIEEDTAQRNPCYREVVQHVNPDILITQENSGPNSISIILGSVLNAGGNQYNAGTFIDGYDSDNGIFYRSSCFHFISNTPIHTALRDVSHFSLVHISTNDTIHIFSCHLKASSGPVNEALRASEADSVRKVTNTLLPGTDFLICGDFNFYGSFEGAYNKLLQDDSTNDGNFVDVISMSGTWNNPVYSAYHTQSPRVRAFGGGATGGLDDRFDLMLFSNAVVAPGRITYQTGTMTPVGNDGLHYGDSINDPPNAAVPQQVAEALHCASDHLPVYADFIFSSSIGIQEVENEISGLNVYPNPSPAEVVAAYTLKAQAQLSISIYNHLGQEIKKIRLQHDMPGSYKIQLTSANELRPGLYMARFRAGDGEVNSTLFIVE